MAFIPHIDTARSLWFMAGSKPYTVYSDNPQYEAVRAIVVGGGDVNEAVNLVDTKELITTFSKGDVTITDRDEVRILGQEVSDAIVDRILRLHKANEPFDSLAAFARLLLQNPNAEVREDLYKWLERGGMPLTEDGHFLAYKKVQDDYFSYYSGKSGKVFHGVGQRVSMEREDCDESRDSTCSSGLHFCSHTYLSNYHGSSGKVVLMKINPRDVTAIPTDYNLSKGRCCAYVVLEEVTDPSTVSFAFNGMAVYRSLNSNPVGLSDEDHIGYEDYDDDYGDDHGRYDW